MEASQLHKPAFSVKVWWEIIVLFLKVEGARYTMATKSYNDMAMATQNLPYHITKQAPHQDFLHEKPKKDEHSSGTNTISIHTHILYLPPASRCRQAKQTSEETGNIHFQRFHGRATTARIAPTSPQTTAHEYPRAALLAAAAPLRWLLALGLRGSTTPAPPFSAEAPPVWPPLWLL